MALANTSILDNHVTTANVLSVHASKAYRGRSIVGWVGEKSRICAYVRGAGVKVVSSRLEGECCLRKACSDLRDLLLVDF